MLKPPEEFHFRGQQPGERVELMLRQHPMTLLEHALKVVALLLVIVFLWRFFGITQWVIMVTPVVLIIASVIAFRSWYGWWNTMMVLRSKGNH